MGPCVLVVGDGMIGPFSSERDAKSYADDCLKEEWHCVTLEPPYKSIPFVMDAGEIDFTLLRDQRNYLLDTIDNEDTIDGFHPLNGIVNLIDDLMDRAAESTDRIEIFGPKEE